MSDSTPPERSAPSAEALLGQVALGNRAAFETLYRTCADKLFGICLRVLRQRAEAEEALQEVFTNVWHKASQFDPERASAMSWLSIMARNKAIDRLRSLPARSMHTSLEEAAGIADPNASPAPSAEAASEQARLARCLEELEPRRRTLIREAFFGGFTYEELATRLAAPLGSVKSWVRRGLIQLRACLEP
ncbi:MAG: sigma-70 family RNA polymerase sigma factor [Proteobacteria bacterium]|nr:sigma-70 family RNA polymerase sigma factor [Pseudomonadota bacterium]